MHDKRTSCATALTAALEPLNSPGQVACGGAHSLALAAGGRAYAWGDNDRGQLGLARVGGLQVRARR
jgi:hypothetical protein